MASVEYLPSPCFVQPLSTRSEVTARLLTRRMNGCQARRCAPDNLSQAPGRPPQDAPGQEQIRRAAGTTPWGPRSWTWHRPCCTLPGPVAREISRAHGWTSMERLFRKYFWAINLLFTALVALLAARTVNVFLESATAPVSTGRGRSTGRAPAAAARPPLDLPRLADLVG